MRTFLRLSMLLVVGLLFGLVSSPFTALAASPSTPTAGDRTTTQDTVELVFFRGEGCPHCAEEEEWLEQALDEYPQLEVTDYEVWYDEDNRDLLVETAADMGFEPSGVPVTIVGDRHWIGWSDAVRDEIEAILKLEDGTLPAGGDGTSGKTSSVEVPLFGDVTVSSDSLVFSTLVIGFVDGVNPCSLWVISVLLAIVVRTGSRRRVFAIGLTFLFVTAAMYALYMVGIYSAMGVIGHLGLIQLVVAVVAGVFGLVSIKDYFALKKGISFTIKDSSKPGIYKRMRTATRSEGLVPALTATVVLAVGVSLLETPCTAGFPVLWTGLLRANDVGTTEAAGLFGLYMAPFLLDELIVFGIAVATLRASKMQERHGRLLKLIAGTMMVALALTVLISPESMSNPLLALAVFAAAFAAAAVIHLVTRRVRADLWADEEKNAIRAARLRARAERDAHQDVRQ